MKIKIGFTTKKSVLEHPIVSISVNNVLVIPELELDACGSADDPSAEIQYVTIDSDIRDDQIENHCIRVTGLNLFDKYKVAGDFGVQIRYIELGPVNLDYFTKDLIAYNPIQDLAYVTNYLEPEQRTHELVYIEGKQVHRTQGEYADYINLQDGFIELHFCTPLYQWLLSHDFGHLTRSLLSNF